MKQVIEDHFQSFSFYFEGNGKLPGFESRKDMI